ncbi:MAG: hypothetical protein U1F11_06210 [Steroidobacteraceae bacterium]
MAGGGPEIVGAWFVVVGGVAGVELPGVAGVAAGVAVGELAGVVGVDVGTPLAGGAGVTTGVFVGAVLVGVVATAAATRIENGARLAVALPSETLIATFGKSPISLDVGVPLRRPVSVSKVAHAGLFAMANTSRSESASLAVGLKA